MRDHRTPEEEAQAPARRPFAARIATVLLSYGALWTLILGIGHLVSSLGVEFPLIDHDRTSTLTHLWFASFLLASGGGGLYFVCRERRKERRFEQLAARRPFDAIYERASEHVREARKNEGV